MDILKYVDSYIAMGFYPIPLQYQSKKPIIPGWTRLSPSSSRKVFERGLHNLGLRGGGNLIFLDVDLSINPDIIDGSDFLLRYLDAFPKTVVTVTGKHDDDKSKSGIWMPGIDGMPHRFGFHLWFFNEEPELMKSQNFILKNKDGKKISLDVRGEGGQAVTAPSIHENGERYRIFLPSSREAFQGGEWLGEGNFLDKILNIKEVPQLYDLLKKYWVENVPLP